MQQSGTFNNNAPKQHNLLTLQIHKRSRWKSLFKPFILAIASALIHSDSSCDGDRYSKETHCKSAKYVHLHDGLLRFLHRLLFGVFQRHFDSICAIFPPDYPSRSRAKLWFLRMFSLHPSPDLLRMLCFERSAAATSRSLFLVPCKRHVIGTRWRRQRSALKRVENSPKCSAAIGHRKLMNIHILWPRVSWIFKLWPASNVWLS